MDKGGGHNVQWRAGLSRDNVKRKKKGKKKERKKGRRKEGKRKREKKKKKKGGSEAVRSSVHLKVVSLAGANLVGRQTERVRQQGQARVSAGAARLEAHTRQKDHANGKTEREKEMASTNGAIEALDNATKAGACSTVQKLW